MRPWIACTVMWLAGAAHADPKPTPPPPLPLGLPLAAADVDGDGSIDLVYAMDFGIGVFGRGVNTSVGLYSPNW